VTLLKIFFNFLFLYFKDKKYLLNIEESGINHKLIFLFISLQIIPQFLINIEIYIY
jgi:hypothetical protein